MNSSWSFLFLFSFFIFPLSLSLFVTGTYEKTPERKIGTSRYNRITLNIVFTKIARNPCRSKCMTNDSLLSSSSLPSSTVMTLQWNIMRLACSFYTSQKWGGWGEKHTRLQIYGYLMHLSLAKLTHVYTCIRFCVLRPDSAAILRKLVLFLTFFLSFRFSINRLCIFGTFSSCHFWIISENVPRTVPAEYNWATNYKRDSWAILGLFIRQFYTEVCVLDSIFFYSFSFYPANLSVKKREQVHNITFRYITYLAIVFFFL